MVQAHGEYVFVVQITTKIIWNTRTSIERWEWLNMLQIHLEIFNYATKASLISNIQRIAFSKVIRKSQGDECIRIFVLHTIEFVKLVQRFMVHKMRTENKTAKVNFEHSARKEDGAQRTRGLTRIFMCPLLHLPFITPIVPCGACTFVLDARGKQKIHECRTQRKASQYREYVHAAGQELGKRTYDQRYGINYKDIFGYVVARIHLSRLRYLKYHQLITHENWKHFSHSIASMPATEIFGVNYSNISPSKGCYRGTADQRLTNLKSE